MKFLKKRIFLLLFGGVFATTLIAGGMHFSQHKAQYHIAFVTKMITVELGLNPSQVATFGKFTIALLNTKKEMHKDHAKTKKTVLALIEKATLDKDEIVQIANQKIDLLRSRIPGMVQALANFYDGLTEQQRVKLRKHIKQKIAHCAAHHRNS